jgi:hypothetical protein
MLLMVRSAKRVSNHEATEGPASFETRALRALQDEELKLLVTQQNQPALRTVGVGREIANCFANFLQ